MEDHNSTEKGNTSLQKLCTAIHSIGNEHDRHWLAKLRPLRISESKVAIEAPDKYHRDLICDHFGDIIASTCAETLGREVKIEWVVASASPSQKPENSKCDLHKPKTSLQKPTTVESLNLVRLIETSVVEGNIVEHPLFKLSNREAKPHHGIGKDGRLIQYKEDYTCTYELGSGARIIIEADMHHGYPTVFGMRVLLAILEHSRSLGFPSRRVPITRAEIARYLGMYEGSRPGGYQFSYIVEAVRALQGIKIIFENTWYDTIKRMRTSVAGEQIITGFNFDSKDCEGFVELGERFYESLKVGYRVGIDMDYINGLDSPTAQRLYVYLTKKDGEGRSSYTENMCSLAKKLPIANTKPNHILRTLEPALKLLEKPCKSGKQFLIGHKFEGKGRDTNLIVHFAGVSLRDLG